MIKMRQKISQEVFAACNELFGIEAGVELTRPEEQFGDYATNVALQLAKQLGKPPREIAEELAVKTREKLAGEVSEVSVAGPGFMNLKLTDEALIETLETEPEQSLSGKTVVAEYSDPNPFKMLHAGHVYTTIVGDAIANLMEASGGEVHRVNYGGDVGLHVGKTMWAVLERLGGENPTKLDGVEPQERSAWLAAAYVKGNNVYETDETAKKNITELNKRVYQLHADDDHDSDFAKIYWTCRQWSYEAFDAFYERLGANMEKYYPESKVAGLGLEAVKKHIGDVFTESDGAIVFDGEKYNLHTRVFINSQGLPTYEAKEVGLMIKKKEDYNFDKSVIITANEQEQYMVVVLKAMEHFLPDLVEATTHIPHGMVRLAGGVKMSSRLGNIIPADTVIDLTIEAITAADRPPNNETVLGAIKYAFLKNRLGGDLIFDPDESVSLEGNSGPYLQYAHARARSILAKASAADGQIVELQPGERTLARKISEYPEIVDKAAAELMPHHVCTYLYELAQSFNRFYENNRVIGDERQAARLALVAKYADTLKGGLQLLGIASPDKM